MFFFVGVHSHMREFEYSFFFAERFGRLLKDPNSLCFPITSFEKRSVVNQLIYSNRLLYQTLPITWGGANCSPLSVVASTFLCERSSIPPRPHIIYKSHLGFNTSFVSSNTLVALVWIRKSQLQQNTSDVVGCLERYTLYSEAESRSICLLGNLRSCSTMLIDGPKNL